MPRLRFLAFAALSACATMSDASTDLVTSRPFGFAADGQPATLWTLRNGRLEVDVTDRGATLVALRAPDRAGFRADVLAGFDDVAGYQSDRNQYFGATIGRVANRIRGAEFELDGYTYVLAANNDRHHLHGGRERSFDKVHWRGAVVAGPDGAPAVRFSYRSRDGEEGYPGNLEVTVTYTLLPDDRLQIDYTATSDRRTPVNLTNHAYWNLAGHGAATVLDHTLQVAAAAYTPTDDELLPTGRIDPVVGTPLDFTRPVPLGLRIAPLLETKAAGYDHNLVLDGGAGTLRRVAMLRHPASGRVLEIETTEPGLQLYTGNFLFGQRGKAGRMYAQHSAVCLETQHFPDSLHHPRFPSIVLAPGRTLRSTTRYVLRVE